MAERKVLNKYYPPHFDPSKIPRRKPASASTAHQKIVTNMLPMTLRCSICLTYMGAGKKFNMRKELAIHEDYLGIKIFRFYFRCSNCSSEIALKTDPKNSGYVVEFGATSRTYDHTPDACALVGDPWSMLERRTLVSKREIDRDAALDELWSLQARHEKITTNTMLQAVQQVEEKELLAEEEEDEAIARQVVF